MGVVTRRVGVVAFAVVEAAARVSLPGFRIRIARAFVPATTCSRSGPLDPKDVEIGKLVVIGEEQVTTLSDSDAYGAVVLDNMSVQVLGEG